MCTINYTFATTVLQILFEERRKANCKRWNNGRKPQRFQFRDVAKAHVQSNKSLTQEK